MEECQDDEWFEIETPEKLAARLDACEAPYVAPRDGSEPEAVSAAEVFTCPKVDPKTSLRLLRDDNELARFFEQHQHEYRNFRSLLRAIDHDGATAIEDEIVEQQKQARAAAIAELRAAPKYPGCRRDTGVLKQMVDLKGRSLPPRLQQVYSLCIDQGLSLNECAQTLGIGRETVRTHLRRLRAEVPAAWREAKTA